MVFATIFPETENVHLIKDVGMIPYIMYKKYGFDSKIICYNNGNYPYLKSDVNGLKIDFIKKYTNKPLIDGIIYLLKNSRRIDVLHLFHFNKRSSMWILVYKSLNKKGKVYLKMDADQHIKFATNPSEKSLKAYLKRKILNKINLISVENTTIYKFIKEQWKINVKLIPNGFYDKDKREKVNYDDKENIILTVGRIGTYQKATEVLLQGFKLANKSIENWKLRIVGPIEEGYKKYVDEFFSNNPQLNNKIEFVGEISDRKKLEAEYKKAKIFCLVSRYESFGIVFLEAMKSGCYIVTSNVESAEDITKYRKYGSIFKIDDVEELSQYLIDACNNYSNFKSKCNEVQEYVYKEFYWPEICKKIIEYLNIQG